MHGLLLGLSKWYHVYLGIEYDGVHQLPFGLVLKYSQRTSLEEYAAMHMARAAGIPVPLALSCGESQDDSGKTCFSILMTRLPGAELRDSDGRFFAKSEGPWLLELKACLDAMRSWRSPYADDVCSVLRTPVRSHFLRGEEDLYQESQASNLYQRMTFTHGDFQAHNILVDDEGHLSGLLDWECAGWYPGGWEYSIPRAQTPGSWWSQAVEWMGGSKYQQGQRLGSIVQRQIPSSRYL